MDPEGRHRSCLIASYLPFGLAALPASPGEQHKTGDISRASVSGGMESIKERSIPLTTLFFFSSAAAAAAAAPSLLSC